MDTVIRLLQNINGEEVGLVGGKGANLGRLMQMGLPVPPGFVVTVNAYRAFLNANNLTGADSEMLRNHIPAAPIPRDIGRAILTAYQQLGTTSVAIRSSATAEDHATASFAGQHDTFLNINRPEALLEAVRKCWASLWSPRAVEYRQQRGWDDNELTLAVVVQTMVNAEWAGVMFTANPITGQREEMIVEAVPGLGESLVSGEASGIHHVVDKNTLRVSPLDSALPAPVINEVVRLGLQIEKAFGQPQDIEWAYAEGNSYILQSRPITTLREKSPETMPRPRRKYTAAQRANAPNMVERMPLPYHPFDYSLYFRPGMERAFQALRSLGFSPPAIEDVVIEIADGVIQIIPPVPRPTIRALTLPLKLGAALRAEPKGWLEECRRNLVATAHRIDEEDISALSDADLMGRIETLQKLQADLFLPRFGRFPRGMFISQAFSFFLRLLVGAQASKMETELLSGIPCTTTEMNRELGRLARSIRGSEELRQVFMEENPERIPARLNGSDTGRAFLSEMEAFIQRYGYRETAMPASALPAWRDEPGIVYGLLKGLVTDEDGPSALDRDDASRAERAKQEMMAILARGPFGLRRRLLLPLFLKVLEATRDFVAFREDSHFYLFMPFPVIRRLALELGRRLTLRSFLEEASDIFFLELAEIKRLGSPAEVREKIKRRKRARQSVEGKFTIVPAELLEESATTDELRGVPVSPGQAAGRVRVILNEKDFWKLQKGEVLVARYTNPAWTPLFALAAGVVVELGGATSHAAIVAREYGVPTVMGVNNAVQRLRDGQRVLVDGENGKVLLVGGTSGGSNERN